MLKDRRQDFYDSGETIYLNCANQGPMPRVAIEAVERSLILKKTPHEIKDEHHFTFPDEYRRAVSRLVGAAPEQIAVTDSATQGIMLITEGLDWQAGDEVLLPPLTFPSNYFPWLALENRGVTVRQVKARDARCGVEAFAAALTPKTRVISVGWVHYSTGFRQDLDALGQLCQDRGVLLVVDATQGVGGLPLDLAETHCDLLTCAGYKWMFGPYGLGFAYVAPHLIERLKVRNINWHAIVGADDFSRLGSCKLELVPTAQRFDRNEPAAFFDLPGGTAAVEYILDLTPEAIRAYVRELLDRLIAGLPPGFRPVSSLQPGDRSNILCVAAESLEATVASFERLRAANIRVSLREGAIRISPNVYNTAAEIDRVLELLETPAGLRVAVV